MNVNVNVKGKGRGVGGIDVRGVITMSWTRRGETKMPQREISLGGTVREEEGKGVFGNWGEESINCLFSQGMMDHRCSIRGERQLGRFFFFLQRKWKSNTVNRASGTALQTGTKAKGNFPFVDLN